MAKRGVYKHLKRIHAPKSWMLSKVGGIWAIKPSQGPHKLRECIPLNVLLRTKLKLALNSKEAKFIVKAKEGNISIDGKVRTDHKYPVGIMDIVTINKAGANYRVNFDVKGRWRLVKISKEEAKMSKKEFKQAREAMPYSNISYRIADEITARADLEVRVTIPGHVQRGGEPCAYDRVLATRFGAKAAELIINKKYGYMVGLKDNVVVPVPLSEVAGKLKTVPLDDEVIIAARNIGISFGD